MEHYAGLDVSLKETSLCIVDGACKITAETKVASEPEALVGYFSSLTIKVVRIGLEAGPLSQWLHAALTQAGYKVVLLETRHVKAALSAMTVKTDRRDARGIAQLLRMGWYRPVHCKTLPSQEVRAILTARKTLLGKLIDIELSMRGILRGFGLKVGTVTRKSPKIRVRELTEGQSTLTTIMEGLLKARATLVAEVAKLHRELLTIARADRAGGLGLCSADDGAGRGSLDGLGLQDGDRRPHTDRTVAQCWSAVRADTGALPIRRDRHHRQDHESRGRHGTNRTV
jgi:transposase